MKKSILLAIAVVFLSGATRGQATNEKATRPEENKNLFAELTGGLSSGPREGLVYGQAGFTYQWRQQVIRISYNSAAEFNLFNSDYYSVDHLSLSYGRVLQEQNWLFTFSAGAGLFTRTFHDNTGGGLFSEETGYYDESRKSTIGFPAEAEVAYIPRWIGIGARAGVNFNNIQSVGYGGLVIKFRLMKQ